VSANTHHVRRLRVRAPNDTLVGRARNVLEDALRVATLPGADARVIVIRRLQLPAFKANTSSQSLSLEIERLIAALGAELVHAESPSAETAAAVWFRDTLQAHTLLALRLLKGPPPTQWYWAAAVPAVRMHADVLETLRAITLSLAYLPEAAAAVPNFLRQLVSCGHEHRVLASLSESDFAVLLAASGAAPTTRDDTRHRNLLLSSESALAREPSAITERRAVRTPAVTDARSSALQRLLEVGVTAARTNPAPSMSRPQVRAANHARPQSASIPQHVEPVASSLDRPAPPQEVEESRSLARDLRPAHPADQQPTLAATSSSPSVTKDMELKEDEAQSSVDLTSSLTVDRMDTAAGGLMFLLPVLMRMGYVQWLEGAPQWQSSRIERRVLRRVCEQLRLPADDVAWRLTDAPSLPSPAMSGGGEDQNPESQLQLSPPLTASTPPPPPVVGGGGRWGHPSRRRHETITRAWSLAIHRWLRLHAHLSVRTLVMRPAQISMTPTHVDVHFDLAATDLAVRRAGLDADPGWLPWYGRVVSYHYERHS
jgi:hypothetical protein